MLPSSTPFIKLDQLESSVLLAKLWSTTKVITNSFILLFDFSEREKLCGTAPPAGDGKQRKGSVKSKECFKCAFAGSVASLSTRVPTVVYCLRAAETWLPSFHLQKRQLIAFQRLDAIIFGHRSMMCYVCMSGKLLLDMHTVCVCNTQEFRNTGQCIVGLIHTSTNTASCCASNIRVVWKTIPQLVVLVTSCISAVSLTGETARWKQWTICMFFKTKLALTAKPFFLSYLYSKLLWHLLWKHTSFTKGLLF